MLTDDGPGTGSTVKISQSSGSPHVCGIGEIGSLDLKTVLACPIHCFLHIRFSSIAFLFFLS